MGTFYGTVQLRLDDVTEVVGILATFAASSQQSFYVAPARSGWVAVFPEGHGQDVEIARRLSRELRCAAFHLVLHDSDVFAYLFVRDGELRDSFTSRPGYLGTARASVPHPAEFADVLPEGVEPGEVDTLLNATRFPAFAPEEALEKFASLVGLAYPLNSFEYLEAGERVGVPRTIRFRRVPAPTKGKREPATKSRARIRDAARSNLLLAELDPARTTGYVADPFSDGLILVRRDNSVPQWRYELETQAPALHEPPRGLGIGFEARHPVIVPSADGATILVARTPAGVQLWDRQTAVLRATFQPPDLVIGAALAGPRSARLIYRTHDEETRSLSDGTASRPTTPTFSVSEEALVVTDERGRKRALLLEGGARLGEVTLADDGSFVFATSDAALFVWTADDLLRATDVAPRPMHVVPGRPRTIRRPRLSYESRHVYSAAYDGARRALAYSGDGYIGVLQLESGKVATVLEMAEGERVGGLTFIRRRSVLVTSSWFLDERKPVENPSVRLWDWPELLRRAGA